MAYITKEEVAAIRAALKAEFGASWKFSVTLENYSGVRIAVMESPLDFAAASIGRDADGNRRDLSSGHCSINEWRLDSHWSGEALVALQKISEIAHSQGWYDRSDRMTDYFDIAYFIWLSIGRWDKPYKMVVPKTTAVRPKFSGSALDTEAIFAGGTVAPFTHTKTGEVLQVLKVQELSSDEFAEFRDWMKSEGRGYYSRYAHGFVLTTDKNQEVA